MSDIVQTPKEKKYAELLYTVHTKGIFINGFDIKFKPNQYKSFNAWYDNLSDEQQWKVIELYRPLTRYERRH